MLTVKPVDDGNGQDNASRVPVCVESLIVYGNRRKARWAVYAPGTSCTETVPSPTGPPCTEIGEKRARQEPVRQKSFPPGPARAASRDEVYWYVPAKPAVC